MIRKLKTLGLAAVAIAALSAMSAAAAQAEPADFAAGAYPVLAHAEADPSDPTQHFQVNPGPLDCQEVTGHAALTAEGPTLTSTNIVYGDCLFNNSISFTPNMNGCGYVFHAGEMTSGTTAKGTVDIECPTGKVIEIGIGGLCLVKVGPQTGLGPVTYHNEEGGHVTVNAEVREKIAYSYSGLLCGSGSPKNGTYEGSITVSGTVEGEPTSIEVTGTP